jgi:hypothetical protein
VEAIRIGQASEKRLQVKSISCIRFPSRPNATNGSEIIVTRYARRLLGKTGIQLSFYKKSEGVCDGG